MVRKSIWAILILLPVIPLAFAVVSCWWTMAITYAPVRSSGESRMQTFILPNNSGELPDPEPWTRPAGNGCDLAFSQLSDFDRCDPHVTLDTVNGSIYLFWCHLSSSQGLQQPHEMSYAVLDVRREISCLNQGRWTQVSLTIVPLGRLAGALLLPLLLMTLIAILRGPLRRHLRRRRGLCEKCAYDLRGNMKGVCPECGTSHGMASPSE